MDEKKIDIYIFLHFYYFHLNKQRTNGSLSKTMGKEI